MLVEARKLDIRPTPKAEREVMTGRDWLQSLAFFVPLGVIICLLLQGRTLQYAGFNALAVATVMCLALFPEFRKPKAWFTALIDAGMARFETARLPAWQTGARLIAALLLLWPTTTPTVVGAALGLILIFLARPKAARTVLS